MADGLRLLTEDAIFYCNHATGRATPAPSQRWVTIEERAVIVENDPVGRTVSGCNNTNVAAGMVACSSTLNVEHGYSDFLFIDGAPVCLQTLGGKTVGTPPGTTTWSLLSEKQELVRAPS